MYQRGRRGKRNSDTLSSISARCPLFPSVIPEKQMRPKWAALTIPRRRFRDKVERGVSILKNGETRRESRASRRNRATCNSRAAAETFPLRPEMPLLCFPWEKGPGPVWLTRSTLRRRSTVRWRTAFAVSLLRSLGSPLSITPPRHPRNNPRSQIDSLLSFIDASTMYNRDKDISVATARHILRQLTIRIGDLKLAVQLTIFFVDGKCISSVRRW